MVAHGKERNYAGQSAVISSSRFVVSLDFELAWGMSRDYALGAYREHILGARRAIPRMLDLFERYGLHCTWATVGLLFFDNKDELQANLPSVRPRYIDEKLSSYGRISDIGESERDDPLHYALSLIRQIGACPGQEIACHTFSHFYCLEEGQDEASFRADLVASQNAARRQGISLKSLVFPRNQIRLSYLPICRETGFHAYRGNPNFWLYKSRSRGEEKPWLRAIRLADSYFPLSKHRVQNERYSTGDLVDVPASVFLRPVAGRINRMDNLRLTRIKRSMTSAAKTRSLFHLWWHPENFGRHIDSNLQILRSILDHYRTLKLQYGMAACTMAEAAGEIASATSKAT